MKTIDDQGGFRRQDIPADLDMLLQQLEEKGSDPLYFRALRQYYRGLYKTLEQFKDQAEQDRQQVGGLEPIAPQLDEVLEVTNEGFDEVDVEEIESQVAPFLRARDYDLDDYTVYLVAVTPELSPSEWGLLDSADKHLVRLDARDFHGFAYIYGARRGSAFKNYSEEVLSMNDYFDIIYGGYERGNSTVDPDPEDMSTAHRLRKEGKYNTSMAFAAKRMVERYVAERE